jgi:hypothetical protein
MGTAGKLDGILFGNFLHADGEGHKDDSFGQWIQAACLAIDQFLPVRNVGKVEVEGHSYSPIRGFANAWDYKQGTDAMHSSGS